MVTKYKLHHGNQMDGKGKKKNKVHRLTLRGKKGQNTIMKIATGCLRNYLDCEQKTNQHTN